MNRSSEEIKVDTEEWLDERWRIANMDDARPQDISYYNGAIAAIILVGYELKRDGSGKHTLYKAK